MAEAEPAEDEDREANGGASGSRLERARLRKAALEARARRIAERAQTERGRHGSVDAVFVMADRDFEVGGGIIAGALAFRLFIWQLPLALVLIGGLGVAADEASTSPKDAAGSLGLESLVSSSIAGAAKSSGHWYALLVGVPALVLATRSILRVLIGAHRLVWGDVRAAAPRPTYLASVRLLVLLLAVLVVSALAGWARESSGGGLGLAVTLAVGSVYAGIWLLIALRLPHRGAGLTALLPGAALFGIGVEVMQVIAAYLIGPYAVSKQGTYGALGVAAALLIGLFLFSRLVVATAVVNATLWERRCASS
jgi:uncharacterized BrkB/YihY/UPF0761 family membrane protein